MSGRDTDDAAGSRAPGEDAVACRVEGLVKTYRAGFLGRRQIAVGGITFTVRRGAVTGLLGHNGAGKTTTLKAILDLVRPDAGRIEIFGRDHRDRRARSAVGYLPETPYFYDHLTAAELLDFYGRLSGLAPRERARRADEVLSQVGMADQARTPLRKCSKGMLQRIGLAQALLHEPALLILDEPMSGLDPLGRREVRDLLGELRHRGTTILLSSHIVPDLEALADEVLMLQQGCLAGVHDLRSVAAPHFEVWLTDLPIDQRAAALWAGTKPRPAGGGREGCTVTLAGLPRLRVLLALCADEGIAVRGVQSRQTGLEEAFLTALGASAPFTSDTAQSPPESSVATPAASVRPQRLASSTVSVASAEATSSQGCELEAEEPVLVGAGEEVAR